MVMTGSMADRRDIDRRNPTALREDLNLTSKSLRRRLVAHCHIQRFNYGIWKNLNAIEFLFQVPKELKPSEHPKLISVRETRLGASSVEVIESSTPNVSKSGATGRCKA